jgi:hypothetical protein
MPKVSPTVEAKAAALQDRRVHGHFVQRVLCEGSTANWHRPAESALQQQLSLSELSHQLSPSALRTAPGRRPSQGGSAAEQTSALWASCLGDSASALQRCQQRLAAADADTSDCFC